MGEEVEVLDQPEAEESLEEASPEDLNTVPAHELEYEDLEKALSEETTVEKPSEPEESVEEEVEEEQPQEEAPAVDDALAKKMEGMEKMLARQRTEIGELRRRDQERLLAQNQEKSPEDNQKFLDEFMENPTAALQTELDRRDAMRGQINNTISDTRETLIQSHPGIEDNIQAMAKIVESDGIQVPANFSEAIWNEDPGVIVNLHKRAEAQKEIDTLRGQLAQKEKMQKDFAKKLDKASSARPNVNGKSGQSTPKGVFDMPKTGIINLGDDELKTLLKQAQEMEG